MHAMLSSKQRALTFWLVCLPLRSTLACVARALTSPTTGTTHPALRALATLPAYRWLADLARGLPCAAEVTAHGRG